jgi:hypothetical protein
MAGDRPIWKNYISNDMYLIRCYHVGRKRYPLSSQAFFLSSNTLQCLERFPYIDSSH